jgi:Ca2+-binding EF-hand superfamily protein
MSSGKKKLSAGGGAKKAQRATSNVFSLFTQTQIQEYKEAFQLMDSNKDGFLDINDLRATFDSLGRIVPDHDLEAMIAEAPGPINFTMFLSIFGERIHGADPEEVILNAFKTFDMENTGNIDVDNLRKFLGKWGEKLSVDEMDDAFGEAPIKSGQLDYKSYTRLITRGPEDENATSA